LFEREFAEFAVRFPVLIGIWKWGRKLRTAAEAVRSSAQEEVPALKHG